MLGNTGAIASRGQEELLPRVRAARHGRAPKPISRLTQRLWAGQQALRSPGPEPSQPLLPPPAGRPIPLGRLMGFRAAMLARLLLAPLLLRRRQRRLLLPLRVVLLRRTWRCWRRTWTLT